MPACRARRYNVQTAVDVEHHLIVAHEVTNVGHDRTQLVPMALRAQEATGNDRAETGPDPPELKGCRERLLAFGRELVRGQRPNPTSSGTQLSQPSTCD